MYLTATQPAAPGVLTYLGGIPAALVNDHHEVFFYWWKSNLKNAVLFHVDGHPDTDVYGGVTSLKSPHDYAKLNIANFIHAAAYHGMVSSIYWLNPHSLERRLQDLGTTRQDDQQRTKLKMYTWAWHSAIYKAEHNIVKGQGEIITVDQIFIPKDSPMVLDVDLDAFCCHRNETLRNLPVNARKYDGVFGFEKRIDEAVVTLATLPRPNLITIASSEGDRKQRCFVPPFMLKRVSDYLAVSLRSLYG